MSKCKYCNNTGYVVTQYRDGSTQTDRCKCGIKPKESALSLDEIREVVFKSLNEYLGCKTNKCPQVDCRECLMFEFNKKAKEETNARTE